MILLENKMKPQSKIPFCQNGIFSYLAGTVLLAHPSTLHDKAQVPVGKVYQYVHPCAFKFIGVR